jgi:hypothetical protein
MALFFLLRMGLVNASPFAALGVPYVAPDGREVVVAVVKATFLRARDGRVHLADVQVPVRVADVHYDGGAEEPPETSVRYPSDVGTEKRGADVVVVGEAVARSRVAAVDVVVQVRDRKAPLRVHGARVYYRALGRVAVSPAATFERKRIVYEHAYGGSSADFSVVERRNPVGRGVARSQGDLVETPAPSIEHPEHPITSAGDAPEPAGYGAVAGHWEPRTTFAGTFDEAWKAARMPLMPLDFDARYFNVAHPSLQFEEGLAPRDKIAVLGMTAEGLWQIELPALPVVVRGKRDDGRTIEQRPRVDLVLVEPGDDRIEITARSALPKGRGRTLLRELQVDVDG